MATDGVKTLLMVDKALCFGTQHAAPESQFMLALLVPQAMPGVELAAIAAVQALAQRVKEPQYGPR